MKEIYLIMSHNIKDESDNVIVAFSNYQNAMKRCEQINDMYMKNDILRYTWICHRQIEDE